MRVLRCACLMSMIFLAVQLIAVGADRPVRAATVEDPADYSIAITCYATKAGGSRCTFSAQVAGGDLPIRAFAVPAAALCGDIVDTNLVAGDSGAMVAETDWATIDFAGEVTADNDDQSTYLFTVGESDDDVATVGVPGASLLCATAPAEIGLTVRAVRADDHGTVLPSACFTLSQATGDDSTQLAGPSCDGDDGEADGLIHFGDVPADSTLTVTETQPPAGYQQAADQVVETAGQSLIVNVDHEPVLVEMTEVMVVGVYCAADPGEIDPQQVVDRRLPDGCVPAEAEIYDVTIDGEPEPNGPLISDMTGTVQVSVPVGSRIVVTMLVNSGLPGYTPQENPIVVESAQGELTAVVFLALRDADPSPSPSPSSSPSPSPSPAGSPSPSPETSPSPTASPRPPVASPSPDPSGNPSPGASTGPAPSPSGGAGATETGQSNAAERANGSDAAHQPETQAPVTRLPETGSGARLPDETMRWLVVLIAALGVTGLGWYVRRHPRSTR